MKFWHFILPAIMHLTVAAQPAGNTETYKIEGQSDKYPLYTAVTPQQQTAFYTVFAFSNFNKTKALEYRKTLLAGAENNDALAAFMLAKAYDLYPFGLGNPKDAKVAMKWYTKAAGLKLAAANYFLWETYTYRNMGVPADGNKAQAYLMRAAEYGDKEMQSGVYLKLAYSYYRAPGDSSSNMEDAARPDNDSVLYYVQKALAVDSNAQAIELMMSVYHDRGDYSSEVALVDKSASAYKWLEVGIMLVNGQQVPKDEPRGLQLIYNACEQELIEEGGNPDTYMGGLRAIVELNKLYYCSKVITKEQVSEYLMDPEPDLFCEDY